MAARRGPGQPGSPPGDTAWLSCDPSLPTGTRPFHKLCASTNPSVRHRETRSEEGGGVGPQPRRGMFIDVWTVFAPEGKEELGCGCALEKLSGVGRSSGSENNARVTVERGKGPGRVREGGFRRGDPDGGAVAGRASVAPGAHTFPPRSPAQSLAHSRDIQTDSPFRQSAHSLTLSLGS